MLKLFTCYKINQNGEKSNFWRLHRSPSPVSICMKLWKFVKHNSHFNSANSKYVYGNSIIARKKVAFNNKPS